MRKFWYGFENVASHRLVQESIFLVTSVLIRKWHHIPLVNCQVGLVGFITSDKTPAKNPFSWIFLHHIKCLKSVNCSVSFQPIKLSYERSRHKKLIIIKKKKKSFVVPWLGQLAKPTVRNLQVLQVVFFVLEKPFMIVTDLKMEMKMFWCTLKPDIFLFWNKRGRIFSLPGIYVHQLLSIISCFVVKEHEGRKLILTMMFSDITQDTVDNTRGNTCNRCRNSSEYILSVTWQNSCIPSCIRQICGPSWSLET